MPSFFSILKYYIINLILLDVMDLDDKEERESLGDLRVRIRNSYERV